MFKSSSGGGVGEAGGGGQYEGATVDMLDDGPDTHQPPLPHKNYILFDPPHLDFKEQ